MIELNPQYEKIFDPRNLDDDCDKIAGLMSSKAALIKEAMDAGLFKQAVTMYLQLLKARPRLISTQRTASLPLAASSTRACMTLARTRGLGMTSTILSLSLQVRLLLTRTWARTLVGSR